MSDSLFCKMLTCAFKQTTDVDISHHIYAVNNASSLVCLCALPTTEHPLTNVLCIIGVISLTVVSRLFSLLTFLQPQ